MDAAVQTQALELACKQTGAPDLVLCRRHIAELCARARR
jgi:DNA polymerase-3 subunit delta